MNYNKETFSSDEVIILSKHFTNIDKPVFGLINLPEVVKGALFARYSRSNKSLRRLFLDEFYTEDFKLREIQSVVGNKRAIELYDKMFLEYGDDSVAQLGGAHIACEQVSNILAKFIEKGRLSAYLEQSTRYVYYNIKVHDKYNFFTPLEIENSIYKDEYENYLSSLFETYTTIVNRLTTYLKEIYPKSFDQSLRAWENTIKAKACDTVRGLLPAATKTNLGIYANGQSYEYLLVKMFSSEIEEVREYAKMMLIELRKIIPSFLIRVDLEDRGVQWSKYLSDISTKMKLHASNSRISIHNNEKKSDVELVDWDKDAIDKVVSDALYEYSNYSLHELTQYVKSLYMEDKIKIVNSYFGIRENRRHKPGRATESIFYKFDITSDYGAFRDIQRHRILTIQWQNLSPELGYVVPDEFDYFPELKSIFISAIEKSFALYNKLKREVGCEIAQYVVPFACKIRYYINMNLREALHLIELRTQRQGHPSYRKICNDMFKLIEEKANHKIFTEKMKFVDMNNYHLAREDSEKRYNN